MAQIGLRDYHKLNAFSWDSFHQRINTRLVSVRFYEPDRNTIVIYGLFFVDSSRFVSTNLFIFFYLSCSDSCWFYWDPPRILKATQTPISTLHLFLLPEVLVIHVECFGTSCCAKIQSFTKHDFFSFLTSCHCTPILLDSYFEIVPWNH